MVDNGRFDSDSGASAKVTSVTTFATPPAPSVVGRRLRAILRWAALAIATAGLLHATGVLPAPAGGWLAAPDSLPAVQEILGVALLTTLAPLLQLRVRTGRGEVGFSWGEATTVVACYQLPLGLIPIVFLVAVLTAQLIQLQAGRCASLTRAIHNSAAICIAGAGAAVVTAAAGMRPDDPLGPGAVGALAGGAVAYWVISTLIVAALVVTDLPQRYWPVIRAMVRSKAPMVVGNVAIGVGALAAARASNLWLLALPPALWLVHQTYTYRLRADEERRAWQTFAEATTELNRVDEREAAAAGLGGVRRLFNPSAAEIVIDGPPGEPRAYLIGLDDTVTRTEPHSRRAAVPAAVRPLLAGGARIGELRLYRGTPLSRRDGLMLAAYGDALAAALHDAATNTELRALTERSSYDAAHDGLTGLANRASLLLRGSAMLRAVPPSAPIALLLLDINHFKEVNTTLGHAAGDELLRIAARRLSDKHSASNELLVRLGGDEFALLVTGATAYLPDALEQARDLAAELAVPTEVAGVQLSVEASVGVVVATAGEVDVTELLRRADIAMYQAKRDGSSVSWYDPGRDDASTDRLALLAELREALTGSDQVDLLLQPIVALTTGEPLAVEAFVRWHHPRRGTLRPVHFVRAVEQSELLGQFTRYVLDRALAVAGEVTRFGLPLPMAINLSPRSLHDRQLPEDVANLLERYGVPARQLILEITETVVLSENRVVDDVLAALRALGVQLAVDDFGTGCNALTFLTRIPVDEVKVDRTFVNRMVESAEAAAIVRTTVELGRELGLRVVAEGVETADQRRALLALGCQRGQGFHFYPPMPMNRIVEVLREAAPAPVAPVAPLRRLRAAD